jgi:hypothetical protein
VDNPPWTSDSRSCKSRFGRLSRCRIRLHTGEIGLQAIIIKPVGEAATLRPVDACPSECRRGVERTECSILQVRTARHHRSSLANPRGFERCYIISRVRLAREGIAGSRRVWPPRTEWMVWLQVRVRIDAMRSEAAAIPMLLGGHHGKHDPAQEAHGGDSKSSVAPP